VENIAKDQHFRWFDDFYEIGELLEEGGQAKVWKAASRGSGQAAAVKIIEKEGLQRDKEARLRTEISILRLINHPNVLRLYDVFETSERLYLVTEELSEGTLFTWLQQRNFEANESFAKSIIIDIASGLLCLHSHGVVHRDVKLENVMIRHTRGGRLEGVLIDFGLSCFLGPEQCSTDPVGTLKYAAPEVISRLPYGFKVDCWSLGVILCILLTGRMPFYGKNEQDIAIKILKRTLRLSSERWATVSPEAKAVVQGLLTKKAEERWSLKDVLHSQWLAEDFALVEKTTQVGKF
jgi:calcium-dependent protein kinase